MEILVNAKMAPIMRSLHKGPSAGDEAKVTSPGKVLHVSALAGRTSANGYYLDIDAAEDGISCSSRTGRKVVLMLGAGRRANNNGRPTSIHCSDTAFILDSGAAVHVTGNYALFSSMTALPQGRVVRTANGHTLPVVGSGSVVMEGLRLKDVLYVPGLTRNLVSVSMLAELDYIIQFHGAECYVYDTRPGGAMVGKGHLVSGIYVLEFLQIPIDRAPAPAQRRQFRGAS